MPITYESYINGPKWYRTRKAIRGNHKTCIGCFHQSEHLHLHHTSYRNLGHESRLDVVPLCEACHDRLHSYLKELQMRSSDSAKVWKTLFGMTFSQAIQHGGWTSKSHQKQRRRKKHRRQRYDRKVA